jgi:hypothetical protein
MNKKTIITALLALVTLSASAAVPDSIRKDLEDFKAIMAQFNSSVGDHHVTTAEYSTQTIHIS